MFDYKKFIRIVYTLLLRAFKNFLQTFFPSLVFKKILPLTRITAPLSRRFYPYMHKYTHISIHKPIDLAVQTPVAFILTSQKNKRL